MQAQVIFVLSAILLGSGAAGADGTCPARLDALGADYRQLDPLEETGGCGAARPISLRSLEIMALSGEGTFTCPLAEQLARWTRDVVVPAALQHFGAPPIILRIGTSYQCRPQNRRPGVRLSEHSYANAVDIVGFEWEDRTIVNISPGPDAHSPAGRFQREIRSGACRYFTTVLGPGADDLHDDHLHFDLRRRKGGYRICQ